MNIFGRLLFATWIIVSVAGQAAAQGWISEVRNENQSNAFIEALSLGESSDVPRGHWVYKALYEDRGNNCFFDYPDELFRGAGVLSRFEMAGALNAFFQEGKSQISRLNDPLDWIRRYSR